MWLCLISLWRLSLPLNSEVKTHSLFWSIILCIVAVKFLWLNLHDFSLFWGFSGSSAGKESTCNAGDPGSIPGSGKTPGKGIGYPFQYSWAFPVVQLEKNLPEMRETWVQSLGWEDPLEKGKATHSSILGWRIPWTVQSIGSQRVGYDWAAFTHSLYCVRPELF